MRYHSNKFQKQFFDDIEKIYQDMYWEKEEPYGYYTKNARIYVLDTLDREIIELCSELEEQFKKSEITYDEFRAILDGIKARWIKHQLRLDNPKFTKEEINKLHELLITDGTAKERQDLNLGQIYAREDLTPIQNAWIKYLAGI